MINSPEPFAKLTFASITPEIFLVTRSMAFEQFTQVMPAIFSLIFCIKFSL